MLVSGIEILAKANIDGYAVGAFNTSNLEITQAIIESAEELNAPVIVQVSEGAFNYAGGKNIANIVKTMARDASVPVALHLDHGRDFGILMRSIRYGFTSIMYDGSKYPLPENIERTKRIVDMARAVNISVEAELGKIGGTEDNVSVSEKEAMYTDPDEAVEFVKETGVDYLAIAIGTAHGPYKGVPHLDFERLKEIKSRLGMPIVLHGASGLSEEDIKKAVKLGVNKINIDTDIRQAFAASVRAYLDENKDVYDPRSILGNAKKAMKDVIKKKMIMFGSDNRAKEG
ncbi:class II fructose-1,6-bisphosphate aldolase [Calorimonas adulescens]|uniref:Class II fructose-1,6-bisphosphate aldolase n=1 Tax=Calorimonas adulescens TaxID=2606906 RepID=A0A5D8QEI0_9THEO|nr:class II fructose-1,6-bisphosphate aldolase [Calorimonas adulescens]TZE82911.1 class II fructose-1,6-bisphosphate aldolase [Calorimonas adulescens]